MKKQTKKNKKKINFRYNLSQYWGFLKKYKLLFFITLLVSLLLEASHTVDKFISKVIKTKARGFYWLPDIKDPHF